jgi:RNA polymerase sigma-70 factor (ECF subfamily)
MAAQRLADHEGRELAAIIELHTDLVLRICRARLGNESDAQDAAQETFVRFIEADRSRIVFHAAWLAMVATRVCASVHKDRYRTRDIINAAKAFRATFEQTVDIADVAVDDVWMHLLARQLDFKDFRLLYLLYVERLSSAQVGAALGISAGHVRVLSYRARHRAAEVIARMSAGEHTL